VFSLLVDPVVRQVELAVHVEKRSPFEIGRAIVGLEAPPLLAKSHYHGHLPRLLGQRDDGLAPCLDGDVVAEIPQGVAGETPLREDGEVGAPIFPYIVDPE